MEMEYQQNGILENLTHIKHIRLLQMAKYLLLDQMQMELAVQQGGKTFLQQG